MPFTHDLTDAKSKSKSSLNGDVKSRVHDALDYRPRIQSDPRYDLSDIFPQTGRTRTLHETQTRQIEFELPPRCINLSRSILEFDLDIQVTGDAGANQAGNSHFFKIPADHISCIQRVEVFTRTGVRLMDLDRQQVWGKISNSYFSSKADYSTQLEDTEFSRTAIKDVWIENQNEASLNMDVHHQKLLSRGLRPFVNWQIRNNTLAGVTRKHRKSFSISLDKFRDSILAIDKSLFFGGQVLLIKLSIAPYSKWILENPVYLDEQFRNTAREFKLVHTEAGIPYESLQYPTYVPGTENNVDANNNPNPTPHPSANQSVKSYAKPSSSGGVGTEINAALKLNIENMDAPISLAPTITSATLENLTIRCAFESNPVINSMIKSKVMTGKGLKLFFPYTYNWTEPKGSATGKVSTIVRLNRGYGLRLQRLCWTITNVPSLAPLKETANTETQLTWQATDAALADGVELQRSPRIKSYYTTLNNRRLQERDINIQTSDGIYTQDSFGYAKSVLEKSITNSQAAQLDNWAHVDAFDAYRADKKDFSNVIAGLPLSDDMQYVINAEINSTTPQNQTDVFAVCQRSLHLKADSITVV